MCKGNSIKVETGVGWEKSWSSSDYLAKWTEKEQEKTQGYIQACLEMTKNDLRRRFEEVLDDVLLPDKRTCEQ